MPSLRRVYVYSVCATPGILLWLQGGPELGGGKLRGGYSAFVGPKKLDPQLISQIPRFR